MSNGTVPTDRLSCSSSPSIWPTRRPADIRSIRHAYRREESGPTPEPSHVIVIEAACPDCVQARFETGGQIMVVRTALRVHAMMRHYHLYSYDSGLPFADHDYEVAAG